LILFNDNLDLLIGGYIAILNDIIVLLHLPTYPFILALNFLSSLSQGN
jgi:hypothetical protein